MGAFGAGVFDNDDALDWLEELLESNGAGLILGALDDALAADYLEIPEASAALVAAEVLAARNLRASAALPEDLRGWTERADIVLTGPMLARAQTAVTRVATDSELAELWGESGAAEQWQASLADLRERLDAD
jgi:hypothetical protein